MTQLLSQAIKELEDELISAGYSINYEEPESTNSAYSVSLDSERFVGTVCYWPESLFEFQFNDCASGEVAVLETHEFQSSDSLKNYIKELIFNRFN